MRNYVGEHEPFCAEFNSERFSETLNRDVFGEDVQVDLLIISKKILCRTAFDVNRPLRSNA